MHNWRISKPEALPSGIKNNFGKRIWGITPYRFPEGKRSNSSFMKISLGILEPKPYTISRKEKSLTRNKGDSMGKSEDMAEIQFQKLDLFHCCMKNTYGKF